MSQTTTLLNQGGLQRQIFHLLTNEMHVFITARTVKRFYSNLPFPFKAVSRFQNRFSPALIVRCHKPQKSKLFLRMKCVRREGLVYHVL